ncbi:LacI family DNA-binding transcriptional regulator [bacterium]|nr:LacI family DNA-binding transcriptional regulator [bacterium]
MIAKKSKVSIIDVAQKAGVSPATVSRVLNKTARVSPELTKKVLSAVNELNYVPDPFAHGLKTKRTKSIGLIISDITNPFFPELARGVEDYVSSVGYSLILCNTDAKVENEKRYVELLLNKRIDGLMFTSLRVGEDVIKSLLSDGVPCVLVGRKPENIEGLIYVVTDNYKGGCIAGEYLFKLGHKRFVHVSGPLDNSAGRERLAGFIDALKKHKVKGKNIKVIEGDFTMEGGYRSAREILRLNPLPTAIFFANDAMAIGALQRFWEEKISIPDVFSIVGFDNIKVSSLVSPPLTTISQEIYKIGQLSARELIKIIEGEKGEPIVLEPKLIERRSCRCIK